MSVCVAQTGVDLNKVHLLTYYTWNTRRSWRIDSVLGSANGSQDVRYIFRDVGAWKKYAEKNAVVWVVGVGRAGQPTLDARINVDSLYSKCEDGKRWRGVLGHYPGSCHFGLNDAVDAMAKIAFINCKSKVWRLPSTDAGRPWNSQHGKRLQNPMRIAPVGHDVAGQKSSLGAGPLEDLAKASIRQSMFISYKHDDFDDIKSLKFLDQLAIELARRGVAVWLDRVALAGTGGRKLAQESDQQLTQLLAQGLDQCSAVLGVWRNLYGTPSEIDGENWTGREWAGSGRGTKRVALDPMRVYRRRPGLPKPTERVLLPADPGPAQAGNVADRIVSKCCKLWA